MHSNQVTLQIFRPNWSLQIYIFHFFSSLLLLGMVFFVVALDGSAASPNVFDRTLQLASSKKDKIFLINVQPKVDDPSSHEQTIPVTRPHQQEGQKIMERAKNAALHRGQKILDQYEKRAKEAGFVSGVSQSIHIVVKKIAALGLDLFHSFHLCSHHSILCLWF